MIATARWIGLAVVLVAAHAPADARAQDSERYRGVIAEAVAEYGAHRFAEARALFRRAHELAPSARTLRGIGLTSFELRDYTAAYRALAAALADERRPLSGEQRDQTRRLLERTTRFVGVYTVRLSPGDAQLRVNGDPAELGPDDELVLELGTHEIVAAAPNRPELRRTVRVVGGERDVLELTPQPEPAAPAPTTGPEPVAAPATIPTATTTTTPTPTRDAAPAPAEDADVGPLALVIAGGVLVVGAGAGIAWWVDRQGAVDACAARTSACTNQSELETARDAAAATTIASFVIGAVLVVLGAAMLGSAESSTDAASSCTPAAIGVGCTARF